MLSDYCKICLQTIFASFCWTNYVVITQTLCFLEDTERYDDKTGIKFHKNHCLHITKSFEIAQNMLEIEDIHVPIFSLAKWPHARPCT